MKVYRVIILFLMLVSLTGCFEIIEDVTIHKDGSGKVKYIINASQSKTDINALMLLKEINGYRVPSIAEIASKLEVFTDSVKKTPGFTNVSSTFDSENFIITFTASFDKVERLNSSIFKLWHRFDPQNALTESYFYYANGRFKRQSGKLFSILYQKLKSADRKVLNGATYTSLYRFDQEVISQKNKTAILSKNKNVVFLKVPIKMLVANPVHCNNIILLKP